MKRWLFFNLGRHIHCLNKSFITADSRSQEVKSRMYTCGRHLINRFCQYRAFVRKIQCEKVKLSSVFVLPRVIQTDYRFLSCDILVEESYRSNKTLILCGLLSSLGLQKEKDEESELIMTIKRSILLIQKEEMKKAEQMLHVALKLAQEQQNSQAVVYIYDLLANLAYDTQAFDKAETLFLHVMSHLLATGTPKNDNKVIHISLKLASIYNAKKDYRKAEEGFKFCIENLKKKVDGGVSDEDTVILLAMTLDWYARFELDLGHYKEAFSHFKTAYEMSVQVNGPVSEQNVVLLNDLGTVCCLQNDYDGAIKYLTEAVTVGKSLPEMEDFASIYVNLGAVYMKKLMYDEAKQACEAAWKSAKLHNNKEGLGEANTCLDEIKVARNSK